MRGVFAPDAALHMCHPFGDLTGPDALWNTCIGPLHAAMPDLECRDMIMLAGTNPEGRDWIGSMGDNYMGTFVAPFMDITPTGHLTHMRYHEFYQIENGKISSMQAIWDMPELMMQSGAWPMAPQLGKFLCTPSPLSSDGLNVSGYGQATMDHVIGMLTALCKYPSDPNPCDHGAEKVLAPTFQRVRACRYRYYAWHFRVPQLAPNSNPSRYAVLLLPAIIGLFIHADLSDSIN
ncbi:ester cyclase [Planktotalea sp.]|uniref:ester cyclase n=1 Tax=Planktotalea sp. TaxID=2029877 RepID=UPI0025DE1424|nr:ester cyclase [Planktotalea sp.]